MNVELVFKTFFLNLIVILGFINLVRLSIFHFGSDLYSFKKRRKFKNLKLNTDSLPKIAIILPAYNESLTISSSLQSFMAMNYPKDKYQVYVVNDGSTDITSEIAHSYEFQDPDLITVFNVVN
jgi:poly-beta-1,6-N-acetyl-D-glucosamine synthase